MLDHLQINITKAKKLPDQIAYNNNLTASYDKSLKDNNFNVTTSTSQKITVPIKEYSNKYLVLHQKDFQEKNIQRNLKKNLLQKKRIPFRKYKKINKQNGQNLICKTEPNCEDFYQEHENQQPTFYQNLFEKGSKSTYNRRQQNNFFQVNATVFSHFSSLSKKQIQIYQKLCERQKINNTPAINKYKKINQILQQTGGGCLQIPNAQDKKCQKISTSRALEKYSKIIKINCEDANSILSKMKIKKQFANLNHKNKGRSDISTRKIVLQRKQAPNSMHKINFLESAKKESVLHKNLQKNQNKQTQNSMLQTKRIRNRQRIKTQFSLQDIEKETKKNIKKGYQIDNENFQINGWEINI